MGIVNVNFMTAIDSKEDECDMSLEILCKKCGGKGRICTFQCVINSSGDSYERCDVCKGKGVVYKKEVFTLNLLHIPNYVYWKNKALSLQDDISELLNKQ